MTASAERMARIAAVLRLGEERMLAQPPLCDVERMSLILADDPTFAAMFDADKTALCCALYTARLRLQVYYHDLIAAERVGWSSRDESPSMTLSRFVDQPPLWRRT